MNADYFMNLLMVFIGSVFVNNVVLSQFLGICPFLGISSRIKTAIGMGFAVIFVITFSSAITSIIFKTVLQKLDIEYLQTIVFILVIACLVQFVEMVLKKYSPGLYKSLGVYLPLITTNCAVLGVALLNVKEDYDILTGTGNGIAIATGFTIAIVILAGIREQLEHSDIPKSFKGSPITLITATLMAMAFSGFAGLL